MSSRDFYKRLRHALHPLRREWHARVEFPAQVLAARLRLRAWDRRGRSLPVTVDGVRFQLAPQGAIAEEICREGAFEVREVELILRLLGPGRTFLDVGANAGYFALAAATRHPDARVIAFEPCAATFRTLERNIRLNGLRNVRAVRVALADYAGTAQMHVNAPGKDGLNTLGTPSHPSCRVVAKEDVPVTTLDDFLAPEGVAQVHVLKVDVEGAELLVFRGAQALLRGPSAPAILYEGFAQTMRGFGYGPVEVALLLQDCGYRLFALDSGDGRLTPVEAERAAEAMLLAVKPALASLAPWLAEIIDEA